MGTGESGAGQIISGIIAGADYTLKGSGRVRAGGEQTIIGVDCMDSSGTKLSGGKFELIFDNNDVHSEDAQLHDSRRNYRCDYGLS
ncbi:hypothetical protein GCM10008018_30860 [Paenibacillus marchantiophytorum]|uniref:Uncharacterized protein n=1 Tax=Paenibacillus marchantiophytorum TaxID=1619310 RepID=A0ABQ1ER01_9BACL|nr:hypothetical protein GCM10008018_30860 [Paenibacillus marchantiophytorum]